jgi:hypothetical protein
VTVVDLPTFERRVAVAEWPAFVGWYREWPLQPVFGPVRPLV